MQFTGAWMQLEDIIFSRVNRKKDQQDDFTYLLYTE